MKHTLSAITLTLITFTVAIHSTSLHARTAILAPARDLRLAGPALPPPTLPKNPPTSAALVNIAGPALPPPTLPKNPPTSSALAIVVWSNFPAA